MKKYTFDSNTTFNQYIELFEALKAGGYIKNQQFSDITWYLPCPTSYRDIEMSFDISKFNSFSSPLKAFTLLQRKSGKRPVSIKRDLLRLKEIIKFTHGLSDENKLKDYFSRPLDSNENYHVGSALRKFLYFHPLPKIQEVALEILDGLVYKEPGNRDLPPFEDVLILDDCINTFFKGLSVEESIKFYPIYLWWTLTNIIPMRPIEFLRIKSDCLEKKGDGTYCITVPRYKHQSSDLDEVFWEQSIIVDKDIHTLINEYVLVVNAMGLQSDFLIPELSKINTRFRGPIQKLNKEAASDVQFGQLITYFYEEVVENNYNELFMNRVTPGDTRHFAIINLFLQGFNSLTIARLAGHQEIESPSNYFSHAAHFSSSAVYKLSQNKVEGEIGTKMSDGFLGRRDYQVRKAKFNLETKGDFSEYRRVDYGFCKDKENFPNNCVEDCRICEPYYEFQPSIDEWEEAINWLENYSEELKEKAFNTLDLMAMINEKTYEKLKGIENLDETESKYLSVQLFKYLDHKAIVDARLLNEKLEERMQNE